jgi:hypothetical protein
MKTLQCIPKCSGNIAEGPAFSDPIPDKRGYWRSGNPAKTTSPITAYRDLVRDIGQRHVRRDGLLGMYR